MSLAEVRFSRFGICAPDQRTARRPAVACVAIFIMLLAGVVALPAQNTGATLTGKVTNAFGAAVPDAKVSAKNVATGQSFERETNQEGSYTVTNLPPGDYEVAVSAQGQTETKKVTLAAGATQTLDLPLAAGLSLQDLGFGANQTAANPQEQARLDKRSHMLKMHQRLGLITAAPLLATVITGTQAGGKSTSSTSRDLHAALGGATTGLYFATAYYSIFAPKIPGTQTRGQIKLHKALAFIHGPGMILTPILGIMAFQQKSKGEKVHGIASAHGPVAIVTAAAYGAAILSVSVKF